MHSTQEAKLRAALGSNLQWYETMCRVHLSPGERHPAYWIHRGAVPPYHSSFLTLQDARAAETQLAALRELIAADPQRGFSIKDGFQCLDLAPLGFRELFRATWIFRPAHLPEPVDESGLVWSAVRSISELELWERTWRSMPGNSDVRGRPAPVFPPALLDDPSFCCLLGRRGDTPVATAALNRTVEAVGLWNVFSALEDERAVFAGAARAALRHYPGLPLVDYEQGSSLRAALTVGFEPVHGLTVWLRPASSARA